MLEINNQSKLNKIKKYLKFSKDNSFKQDVFEYLKKYDSGMLPYDEDFLAEIISIIINNNYPFKSSIDCFSKLYDLIIYNNTDEEKRLVINFFKNKLMNGYHDYLYIELLYSVFKDKTILLNIYKYIENKDINDKLLKIYLIDYILEARKYYVDENSLYSSAIQVFDKIYNVKYSETIVKKIIDEELKKEQKIAGIYEINEDDFENNFKNLKKKLDHIETNQKITSMNLRGCEDFYESIKMEEKNLKFREKELKEEIKKINREQIETLTKIKESIECLNNPIEPNNQKSK